LSIKPRARCSIAVAAIEYPADHDLKLRNLAEALRHAGRSDQALALLPADASGDKLITARTARLTSSGQHDQAAALLAEALQARPEAEPIRLMEAEMAKERGRDGEAIGWLQQGLELASRQCTTSLTFRPSLMMGRCESNLNTSVVATTMNGESEA